MEQTDTPAKVASNDQLGLVALLRELRESLDSDDWMGKRRMIEVVDDAIAKAQALHTDNTKSERRAIVFGDIVNSQVIAMQAAVLEGHLKTPAHGLQWIVNTLAGPGHLPDLDEARALGGAQAWFDRETTKHEEFRRAHPGPGPARPNARLSGPERPRTGVTMNTEEKPAVRGPLEPPVGRLVNEDKEG